MDRIMVSDCQHLKVDLNRQIGHEFIADVRSGRCAACGSPVRIDASLLRSLLGDAAEHANVVHFVATPTPTATPTSEPQNDAGP